MPHADKFISITTGKAIYLLGKGTPVNFIDGAVFGPALSLVQAELIVAAKAIHTAAASGELSELGIDLRKRLADDWQKLFIDGATGSFPFSKTTTE